MHDEHDKNCLHCQINKVVERYLHARTGEEIDATEMAGGAQKYDQTAWPVCATELKLDCLAQA
jgi:hypothetical protein